MQLVKCPVCGSHVPVEAAVEIPVAGEPVRFCSVRCAEAGEAEAAGGPARPPGSEPPRRIR
jgi:YHS domain-containing protein